MIEHRLRLAEQVAEKLVRDEGLTLPVDVLSIAASREIQVTAKPASAGGVSGMLIRAGENFAIAYATHIKSSGFQRFSIAHELGHYFLEGHPEAVFKHGTIHESKAGFTSSDQVELEADHFAAGLLMPSHLFRSAAGRFEDGLDAIKGLAAACGTSLTASAIRYAQLTEAAVAVVLSQGPNVVYCVSSRTLREAKGYRHLRKGSNLPSAAATRDFNSDQNNVDAAREASDGTELELWFHTDGEIDATEEIIGLGEYGKTLTVITADLPEDDEEDDGGSEWPEPRFR